MEPLTNEENWDERQLELGGSFLQAKLWADFQQALGHEVYQLAGEGWTCQLIKQQSKLGPYLLAPYGPTVMSGAALPEALAAITKLGRQLDAYWLRLEPCLGLPQNTDFDQFPAPTKAKIVAAPKQVNPRLTRIVDLTIGEEALFANLSSSSRNTIRKNERSQIISFRSSTNPEDIEIFLDMMRVVSQRNRVYFHPEAYFRTQAQILMPSGAMRLEFALQDGQPVAAIIFHDFGVTMTYTYAASLPIARNSNAADLLLWESMKQAAARGLQRLDLFGVAPEDALPSHPWYGFSAFKRKFGGEVIGRGQTIDIVLNPGRYRLYRSALKVSKLAKR